ncbi:hypothetical protein LTR84_006044 [Exophiala bonariae]|uniref:Dienelactone hydrolase domain-containing protein n=1 Tax=Exophiala bonariae TaxID=1690606 RepID=A0AAV9N6P4_9EURO|nr:hypothetical protein LTR84_006044 [Exophiala bonariae]
MSDCCLKGFKWGGTPCGKADKLAGRDCYVTGTNADVAILVLHDLYGWTFSNIRLLANHYAEEVNATVYVPDLFGGEVLSVEIINDQSRWGELNLPDFLKRNSKEIRTREIFECAQDLRTKHKKTGAIGFCFGGWGAFRLGAKDRSLVDCISVAHPTNLEKDEILNINVPVQIMAPEFDPMFTEELKVYSNQTIPTLGVPYDYQFFPGIEHAFAVRGNPKNPEEQKGLERAKNCAVFWFRQWLH